MPETTFTPRLSVGDYTITEATTPGSSYHVLRVTKEKGSWEPIVIIAVALPVPGSAGRVTWGTMSTDHPDLAEACALALDRAAAILREAREATI